MKAEFTWRVTAELLLVLLQSNIWSGSSFLKAHATTWEKCTSAVIDQNFWLVTIKLA